MIKEVKVASDIVLDPFMQPLCTAAPQISFNGRQTEINCDTGHSNTFLPMGTYHPLRHCRLAGHLISFSTSDAPCPWFQSLDVIVTFQLEARGEVQKLAGRS